MAKKVIITCAVTGAIHTPTMSPYLPITPDEIARGVLFLVEDEFGQTSGVVTLEERAVDLESARIAAGEALSTALEALLSMREREGAALSRDLESRLAVVEGVAARLAAFCSSEWKNTAERYCVPTSAPWRLSVVGSCERKNQSSSAENATLLGSKVTCTHSAWPVSPPQTCS